MTRVDFYLLAVSDDLARWRAVCRLAEKAVKARELIHIHTDDPAILGHLDDAMWHYRSDSFLPHQVMPLSVSPADAAQLVQDAAADYAAYTDNPHHENSSPINIACQEIPHADRTVLINLASQVPLFFSRFKRTVEILHEQPDVRADGRLRYQFYRQRGYPLRHHHIDVPEHQGTPMPA